MNRGEEWGRLLSEGIHLISIRQGLNISAVERHLGQALGRKGKHPGSAISYWRQGNLPANAADIEILARQMVEWGGLDVRWLEEFLASIENLRRGDLIDQIPLTAQDDRNEMSLATGLSNLSFMVKSLSDGQEIRNEDLPLTITGHYSPHKGLRAWPLLQDSYGNYYLQDPEMQFLPYNVWIATNVLPGIGIERILFVTADRSDQATLEQMASRREWGAFVGLPPSSIKLASVEITRV